ncbi:MAG: hypothetical protein ABRQ32_06000 [Smithellaceae bacterium]
MKNRVKWIWKGILLFILLPIILIFSFWEAILIHTGRFMAPHGDYIADVAILEGNSFIDRSLVSSGENLLSSGKVKRLIVVLHSIAPVGRPFAFDEDYPGIVKKKMKDIGLKERDFKIIVTHVHHPITLTEAKGVMEDISKENIKCAILLSEGFHTRRSYLVYQHVGNPHKIKIFPSACFTSYKLDHWWSQESGFRDFALELIKLVYYLVRGYIPFKLSYSL